MGEGGVGQRHDHDLSWSRQRFPEHEHPTLNGSVLPVLSAGRCGTYNESRGYLVVTLATTLDISGVESVTEEKLLAFGHPVLKH